MAKCNVCGLEVETAGSNLHYLCGRALEKGEPADEVRSRSRRRAFDEFDEELRWVAKMNVSFAGWQIFLLVIAFTALGASLGREWESLILGVIGFVLGIVMGLGLYYQRKLQSLTARQINSLWREQQDA